MISDVSTTAWVSGVIVSSLIPAMIAHSQDEIHFFLSKQDVLGEMNEGWRCQQTKMGRQWLQGANGSKRRGR
jgi:hypothetical protein